MKCLLVIIIMQSFMSLYLAAMDARQMRRHDYIQRLRRTIQQKEYQIQQNRIMRYTVEFSAPFLVSVIAQPYAAGVMAISIAAICLLTSDIEDAVEARDDFQKRYAAEYAVGLPF